jgi:hypothetical protein
MDGLSVSGLADLAGVTEAEVARLVELGILVAQGGHRRGHPGGPAVVRVPGDGVVPALGGALGADLPAGQPGDRRAPAAIANAVYHATGRRIRSLPITIDQLL